MSKIIALQKQVPEIRHLNRFPRGYEIWKERNCNVCKKDTPKED
jgi:hypothetical protein